MSFVTNPQFRAWNGFFGSRARSIPTTQTSLRNWIKLQLLPELPKAESRRHEDAWKCFARGSMVSRAHDLGRQEQFPQHCFLQQKESIVHFSSLHFFFPPQSTGPFRKPKSATPFFIFPRSILKLRVYNTIVATKPVQLKANSSGNVSFPPRRVSLEMRCCLCSCLLCVHACATLFFATSISQWGCFILGGLFQGVNFYSHLQWYGHLQKLKPNSPWFSILLVTGWGAGHFDPTGPGFLLCFFLPPFCADFGRLPAENIGRITLSREAGREHAPALFPGVQMADGWTTSRHISTVVLVGELLASMAGAALTGDQLGCCCRNWFALSGF